MIRVFSRRLLHAGIKFNLKNHAVINSLGYRKLNYSTDINIVHSPFPDIKFENTTIPEYVYQDFGKFPHKIAVECCITGKKYTYEEVRRKSKNFAKALQKKLKLRKGDVVALLLPNIPDYAICILGALEASLVVTTINPLYTPDEIHRHLLDSNAKVVITLGQLWPNILATTKLLPLANVPKIMTIKMMESEALPPGTINFHEFADNQCDFDLVGNVEMDDLIMMPYSSGTTGVPKGVELSSRNIVSNLLQMDDPYIKFGDITTESHQDVIPGILPWFHIYGLVAILLNNLHLLSKLVSLPKFTPDTYVNMLEKHKPHILYIVPPIVLFMNNSPLVKERHLQSIHTICSGAAPLGALDEEKLQKKAVKEICVVQGYGLTESCSCIFVLSPKTKKKFNATGSIGEPVSNSSVKIVPPDNILGEALGPNVCGELLVKGPQMSAKYHNNPQQSKDALIEGDWFRTGDVAYYDDNKLFYITDRLKELIKVKGFQVAPAELEEVVRSYPGIAEVAVIGVPHELYGEVPRAYVVLEPNTKIEETKLQEHVASKVSSFKQLKGGVVVVPNIPKTPSGKILKKDLKLLRHE